MLPVSTLVQYTSSFDVFSSIIFATTTAIAGFIYLLIKNTNTSKQNDNQVVTTRPDTTLPFFKNTFDILHHPKGMHDWISEQCIKYKGRPWIMSLCGSPDRIIMSNPQAMEDVMKTQFDCFRKDPYAQDAMKDFLGDGIFIAEGSSWFHQRKTTTNMFTMRALKDSMTKIIQNKALVLNDVLLKSSEKNQTIDLYDLLKTFTLEAFAELGFGVELGALGSGEEDAFQRAFGKIQQSLFSRFMMPTWIWKLQRFLNIGREGVLKRSIAEIDDILYDIISRSLANRSENTKTTIVSLFLDTMKTGEKDGNDDEDKVDFHPKAIRDIVLSLLLAGRDTTAQSLSWLFVNLAKNPHVEKKLRHEIITQLPQLGDVSKPRFPDMEQIQNLVYLEATIKETLRLNPVVPFNGRVATKDTVLSDGTFIKAGQNVAIPSYSMGRMESVWGPDALEFKPERWIDAETGKLLAVSSFKFSAFNGGPRICLGKNLAMMEMKIVAAGLLSRFHMEVQNPEKVTYGLGATLHLKDPLRVNVKSLTEGKALAV